MHPQLAPQQKCCPSPTPILQVRAIAMDVGNAVHDDGYVPVICGLSRTRDKVGGGVAGCRLWQQGCRVPVVAAGRPAAKPQQGQQGRQGRI